MKEKRAYFIRYTALAAFFIAACLIYIGRLISIQIAGQDYYTATSASSYTYRYETIHAQRGEIYDRSGIPLVVNAYTYDIDLDAGSMPAAQAERNRVILSVLKDASDAGESDTFTRPASPFVLIPSSDGTRINAEYAPAYLESASAKKLWKLLGQLHITEEDPAQIACETLLLRYGIAAKNEEKEVLLTFPPKEAELLLALRLDMELKDFSAYTPYTLLSDISFPLLCRIEESGVRGIRPRTEATREYTYPGYASHILGRIGKIQSAWLDYYTELGYPMDAVVGISGAEQAFEKYLHGEDGTLTIVEDGFGNIVDEYVSREPKAGANVYLTIDIGMQIAAEDALADNIAYIVEKGALTEDKLDGEDADSGALTAVDTASGAVLALASYPTYNLATFNADYATLSQDPSAPYLNRALDGTYPPGSTFKIGVAAAALTEGIITPTTKIRDEGQYTFYSTYQPACWIYNQYGTNHGAINVTTAIQVSCNYFFYETGRLLGIDTMNRYCRSLGLGVPTGIELPEKTGTLAGPDYRNEQGLGAWNPGDTLSAAIGQSDNAFTPLQISVYMAAIINNGTRLDAHILDRVESFYTGEILYRAEPHAAENAVPLGDGVRNVLLNAMKSVTENGSAARVFSGYPIEIGGKTGTAQVSKTKSDNAIFTAFAPFHDPQIAVTCIIEQGANGTDAGFAVRDVFDYYFHLETAE